MSCSAAPTHRLGIRTPKIVKGRNKKNSHLSGCRACHKSWLSSVKLLSLDHIDRHLSSASSSSSLSSSSSNTMAEHDQLLPAPIEIPGPTSPQSSLLAGRQRYLLFPQFTLESGVTLTNVPIAFKTWGTLAPDTKDNALVVCHALTGSADVEDWWGPLMGIDKVFDYSRFFIVCCNVLGSPYGSASSCTQAGGESDWAHALQHGTLPDMAKQKAEWQGHGWWGPEFPATTVRDDVRIQKLVLEYLGVESVAAVVGGSMGGMAVLEWPLMFPTRWPGERSSTQRYIQALVPLATSARHSAWCISWAEAQRQSIYSDPAFKHGYYEPHQPPRNGLSAARMAALLTYRSRESFESRFGRRLGTALNGGGAAPLSNALPTKPDQEAAQLADQRRRTSLAQDAAAAHNEGNLSPRVAPYGANSSSANGTANGSYFAHSTRTNTSHSTASLSPAATSQAATQTREPTEPCDQAVVRTAPVARSSTLAPSTRTSLIEAFSPSSAPQIFSAQSYLRYQGDKFVRRFDANCYIHLTRKMDSHDVARSRYAWDPTTTPPRREVGEKPESEDDQDAALLNVLGFLSSSMATAPSVLVVSIQSDGLFAPPEQMLIHQLIQGSHFVSINSSDGHDGFLLEFDQINLQVGHFLTRVLSHIYQRRPSPDASLPQLVANKHSVFGEIEDVTRW